MARFILRRISAAVLVLLLASIIIFAFLRVMPGNPGALLAGSDASPADVARVDHQIGLDRPALSQYFSWLGGALHGDLGRSYFTQEAVTHVIGRGLAASGTLAGLALILSVLLAIPLGIAGAVAKNRGIRATLSAFTTGSLAVPTYVTGVLLVLVFSVYLKVMPSGGFVPLTQDPAESLQSLLLPAVCLAVPVSAVLARYLKSSLTEVLDQDYILAVRLRGVSQTRLLWRSALPNALPSMITILGVQAGQILGGAIVVESLFAWPGLGAAVLQAVLDHDYLLVQGLLLLAVGAFVVIQALCDVAHAVLDPRVRQAMA